MTMLTTSRLEAFASLCQCLEVTVNFLNGRFWPFWPFFAGCVGHKTQSAYWCV